MRYEIDNENYIVNVYFGCYGTECIEYTGEVPEGYDTLPLWAANANIRAYRLIDNNLVYDENRDRELQRKYELETEQNKCATQKYVDDKLKQEIDIYEDSLATNLKVNSLFMLKNTKKAPMVYVKVTPNGIIKNKVVVNITNKNILENKLISQEINGVTVTVNEDRTITLNGTSTENIELIINGSLDNTSELFFLKNGVNYRQCGFVSGVSLNLYSYDGTDRTLVNSGSNATIHLNETAYITYVTLSIASGKTFKDVIISPMLTIGVEDEKYVQYQGNIEIINLNEKTFQDIDYVEFQYGYAMFYKINTIFPSNTLYPSNSTYPYYEEDVEYNMCKDFSTFEDLTLIQCDKDVNIEIRYFPKDYINQQMAEIKITTDGISSEVSKKVGNDEIISRINQSAEKISIDASRIDINGTVSANGNFKIETDGSMECTGGNIGGWTINKNGLTNGTVFVNSDGSSTIYTVADLIVMRGYIMGTPGFELPEAMIRHYDLNGDGKVSSMDYTILQNLIGISMS